MTNSHNIGITPASLQYQMQTNQEGNIVGTILEKEQTPSIRIIDSGYRNHSVDQAEPFADFFTVRQIKTHRRTGDDPGK